MSITPDQLEMILRRLFTESGVAPTDDYWTIERTAQYLGHRPLSAVRDLFRRGRIKSIVGGKNNSRITKKAWVDDYLAKLNEKQAAQPRKGKRVGSHNTPQATNAAPRPSRTEA